MKVGDLVSFANVGQPDLTIGLVVNMNTVFVHHGRGFRLGLPSTTESPFVGVLWVDGDGHIDYEREEWLEVVNESR